jgi:hypothetical protein
MCIAYARVHRRLGITALVRFLWTELCCAVLCYVQAEMLVDSD